MTNNLPTSVSISWALPPLEQRNGVIRTYRIQLVEAETGRDWAMVTTATHFLLDFLQENYLYTLRIAAETVMVGPYSEAMNFTTLPDSKLVPKNVGFLYIMQTLQGAVNNAFPSPL